MHQNETIAQCYTRLAADRDAVVRRCETYASLTLPRICPKEGIDFNSEDQPHDFQSIGAIAVNHVVNKLALAMFSPARPFFKVAASPEVKAQFAAAGLAETAISNAFSTMEREACEALDRLGQRPALYRALRHLVITGNALQHFEPEKISIYGIKQYVVKRVKSGGLHTMILEQRMRFDELDEETQAKLPGRYTEDTEVKHYTLIERVKIGNTVHLQQRIAVDEHELTDPEYKGRWLEKDCPWKVLTWELADGADYGTGLVEEYSGDLLSCSVLSEAVVTGGVLAAEFRHLVNPSMQTSVEDFNQSRNGDALAGVEGDIATVSAGNADGVQVAIAISEQFERRISRAFLLNSAMTRDAERVTAEEIRMTAMELETSFGGTYTALASNFQTPLANWLLEKVDTKIDGKDFRVVVITGLDALSRNGELENLRLVFEDLAALQAAPEALLQRIKFDALAEFIASRRGVDFRQFLKTDEEMEQQAQAQMAQDAAAAGAEAGAVSLAEGNE